MLLIFQRNMLLSCSQAKYVGWRCSHVINVFKCGPTIGVLERAVSVHSWFTSLVAWAGSNLLPHLPLVCWTIAAAKAVHNTPMEAHGEERMYSSYSFTTSALDGVSGQHHALAALYPWGKDPQYPLYRRLGRPQSRSGHRG
jgi:hypothetical protein